MAIEQNLHALLNDKPEVVRALYAGCETALLTANRVPTDIDIIVHDDDLDKVADVLSSLRCYDNQPEGVTTGDGQAVGFVCSGIVGRVGDTDVDVMSSASFEVGGKQFPIRLTDLAAEYRLRFRYEDLDVFLANPFDTIFIKAFMRRGVEQGKFDKPDARALVNAVGVNQDYKTKRLQEVGAPAEVLQFLQEVGA